MSKPILYKPNPDVLFVTPPPPFMNNCPDLMCRPLLANIQPSHCAVNTSSQDLEPSFSTYSAGTDAQDKAVNGPKADLYEVLWKKQNEDKCSVPHYSERVGGRHSCCCLRHAPLRLHFVFRLLQRGIKKGLMDVRQESSLILSVISKGSWGHGCRFFCKLGSWGQAESESRVRIYITFSLCTQQLFSR